MEFADGSIDTSTTVTNGSAGDVNLGTPSGQEANQAAGSAHVDLTDDSLVRIPGQDQPVKYGELYKRLQADHTRKAQEVARQRAEFDKERQGWQSTKQQEEQNLRALIAQVMQRQGQSTGSANDPLSKLESMHYLDGKTAASLFREIQENGFGTVAQAIKERDKITESLYAKVAKLEQVVNNLNGSHVEQNFGGKIGKFLKDADLDEQYTDLAKELYLAYEGDDLDQEFPAILQKRVQQIEASIRARDKKRVEAARSKPFGVPGKGGQGSAGKPVGLTGKESSREVADKLWDAMQGSDAT